MAGMSHRTNRRPPGAVAAFSRFRRRDIFFTYLLTYDEAAEETLPSRSDPDRTVWVTQVRTMHTLYKQKQNAHWSRRIADNAGNSKNCGDHWRAFSDVTKTHRLPSRR